MQTIYFTSESERRAVLPDAAEDEAWRERTRLEMPDDNPGNFAPVCDRIHLKASQQSKVPGPKADFIFAAISPCFAKISAVLPRQPFIPASSALRLLAWCRGTLEWVEERLKVGWGWVEEWLRLG